MIQQCAFILAIIATALPRVGYSPTKIQTKKSAPIWFVHITDLHISKFGAARRSEDLRLFCNFMVRNIKPKVVVISGDITDAKHANMYGSEQFKEEWSTYLDILNVCGIQSVAKVLDIRGNHDTFNVLRDQSSENYFNTFGAQGRYHPRSYEESVVTEDGIGIRFVAIDFTRIPGLRRPFNFFGTLTEKEIAPMKDLIAPREEFKHQILFGHYPTSSIHLPGHKVRDLFGHQVYLCGHYHMPTTYLRHKASGLLELELSDWKDRRSYRIAAFDNGQFAFTDKTYHPLKPNVAVIVTNPKNLKFQLLSENISAKTTLDIRALIFSDTNTDKVEVKIDDEDPVPMYLEDPNSEAPLYTTPWKPLKYNSGLHKIKVLVTLPNGDVKYHKDVFSFDGTRPAKFRYNNLKAIALLVPDWQPSSKNIFLGIAAVMILSIIGLRLCLSYSFRHYGNACLREPGCMRKVWLLLNEYFGFVGAFALYGSFGPLMIAPVVDNKYAVVFASGIYMLPNMNYVPADLICLNAVGCFMLHVIFCYILACTLEKRQFPQPGQHTLGELTGWFWGNFTGFQERFHLVWEHLGFFCVLIVQFHNIWALFNSYGILATISPIGIFRPFVCIWIYLSALEPNG